MADELLARLSTLSRLLDDSHLGYGKLATGLRGNDAVLFCVEQSFLRKEYFRELTETMRRLHGYEIDDGTLPGRVHRGWIDLELSLRVSDHVLLGTAVHSEGITLRSFESALESPALHPELHELLLRQMQGVQFALHRAKELRSGSPSQLFQVPAPEAGGQQTP